MSFIIGVLKVIFLLGFLILIHEGGHFLVAKLCKVKVKEFSLGFGPSVYAKQGKETKYSLRAIPFGGYVDMLGETETVEEKGSFSQAKVSQRIAIVAAGAIVNIIFGILAYFLLMTCSGVNSSTTIKQLIPEYQTESSVLQAGDKILEINEEKTRIKSDVDEILLDANGEDLQVLVERNGQTIELTVMPVQIEYGEMTRYILGVEVEQAEKSLSNNCYYGFWETASFLQSVGDSLIKLVTGNVQLNQMTGPVGISEMAVKTSGIYDFVYLLAVVSLSLGVTNLLPIPALDGGKILLLLIEAIRKKKIEEELELKLQSLGFTFLILLSLYVSFNDVIRLF